MRACDAELRVSVLGPPRAWLGDTEIALGPARQRAVFLALATRMGQVVARHELIDGVWGERPPASANGSLHTYVSGLRRALGPARALLATGAAGYSLRLAGCALDAEIFDRARARAQRRFAAGDWRGAALALDAVAGLWRGEAYAGVPGPFAALERARLAEARLSALELHARAAIELGEHGCLLPRLHAEIRAHPLRESLREVLMRALHRSGRPVQALAAFVDARRTLLAEQGIEPGPALRDLRGAIFARVGAPVSQPPVESAAFVGRADQAALLRGLVADVVAGRGRPVWIEGEPGIGKSALLAVAFADAGTRGCALVWAVADESGRVVVEHGHAEPADPLWSTAVDGLSALVDRVRAAGPLVLVIDNLHWADDASVLLWHRLAAATRRLPLLLVAAARPAPNRPRLAQVRRGVRAHGGPVLVLGPLDTADTERLIGRVVGAHPGASLRAVARRAAGNPRYAKEITDNLVREMAVRIVADVAEADPDRAAEAPRSLLAGVRRTLDFLSPHARAVLWSAAVLGEEFGVDDLATVTGTSPVDLVPALDEAAAAAVVVAAGDNLAFGHPFLRQALYESAAPPERAAAHRRAAEALAGAGAPVRSVAEQVAAAPVPVDAWVVRWLVDNHAAVADRAPSIAVDLLRRVLATGLLTRARRASLLTALARVRFHLGQHPEAEAEQALAATADPDEAAEARQVLAALRHRRGDTDGAAAALRDAVDDPAVPRPWRARHRSLLAGFRRGDMNGLADPADLAEAERSARQALAESVAAGEPYPVAHATQTLWLVHSVRRDHGRALRCVDSALAVVGERPDLAELRFDLIDNRVFTLQNLDRLADAEAALRSARETAARHGLPGGLPVSAAVHHYWTGDWDHALADLAEVTEYGPTGIRPGLRDPGAAALLRHGVAALIAARRDDRATAAAHLDAIDARPPRTLPERENCDFSLMVLALTAEQRGAPDEALRVLAPVLRPDHARMMLRHQWLAHVIRLALSVGDPDLARDALAVCAAEADNEVVPARAAAALAHCQALVSGDPAPALTAAAHYRAVGRPLELAAAMEDAAALLAAAGRAQEATAALTEALAEYALVRARWDIRRAEARLATFGVRADPARPGWAALSAIEVRIARLLAAGLPAAEIAIRLAIPRRTVQEHVSGVLDKLWAGAGDRVG
ncbi:BTAD domain-containing putative transcriptional regulator [Actinokineospora iranica]|uniref:DNA-binding transcriptional activator of the SARP family n=1 Tax=Actinokineospora iranica TaxID=1271860 RepID=A0A1G6XCJ4_9PSEU|nr:BTAD domain-containing putative transcriptional regulator [Actinokineospora iranica]SDD75513.1 DNA-binding transcriptional activator of the SARP family [Actinokineospora iranica]